MNQVIAPTEIVAHTPGRFSPHGGPFAPHQGPLTADLPHGELPPLGYSGCEVRLGSWGRGLCVEKRAGGPYGARLDRQIIRQAQARRANTLPFVRIPEVYDTRWTLDGGFMARMEYLLFLDCLRAFATVSRPQIDHTVQLLITYIEANIAASPLQEVPRARFCDKLDQIEATLARTDQLTSFRGLIQSVRGHLPTRALVLPIGRAHGDLTLLSLVTPDHRGPGRSTTRGADPALHGSPAAGALRTLRVGAPSLRPDPGDQLAAYRALCEREPGRPLRPGA